MIDVVAASDRATPGRERITIGSWVARHDEGVTGRANSCTPIGDPGVPLAAAVDRVEAWYGDRDRPAILQLFEPGAPDLVAELDRRGYSHGAVTDILSAPLERLAPVVGLGIRVEVGPDLPPVLAEELSAGRATEMLRSSLPRLFASVGDDAGGMALVDGDRVGVFAMRTVAAAEGRGLGTAVLAALLDEGRRRGARIAWLQVEAANHRAADWYRWLGFERVGGYHYRRQR